MTTPDYPAALAAARDALAKQPTEGPISDSLFVLAARSKALRDLLAALDAAQPVAWALTMPDGVCLIHTTEEASRRAESRWPEAYAGCQHVPFYAAPQAPPAADAALADTQRAIIEAAERRGYERGLREAPPAAVPTNVRERWNIERDGDALRVCFNDHEKGEECEYVRYVSEAPPAAVPAPEVLVRAYFHRFSEVEDDYTIYHTLDGICEQCVPVLIVRDAAALAERVEVGRDK